MEELTMVWRDNKRKNYYYFSRSYIVKKLLEKFPQSKPVEEIENISGYILWMCRELDNFKHSRKGSRKAARWIGYILRAAEEVNLLDNKKSRELTRKDEKNKFV